MKHKKMQKKGHDDSDEIDDIGDDNEAIYEDSDKSHTDNVSNTAELKQTGYDVRKLVSETHVLNADTSGYHSDDNEEIDVVESDDDSS